MLRKKKQPGENLFFIYYFSQFSLHWVSLKITKNKLVLNLTKLGG